MNKKFFKSLVTFATAVFAACSTLIVSSVAVAAEVVAPSAEMTWFAENWFVVIPAILYGVSHIMAALPIGARWPTMLKHIADIIGANYGHTKNANQSSTKR